MYIQFGRGSGDNRDEYEKEEVDYGRPDTGKIKCSRKAARNAAEGLRREALEENPDRYSGWPYGAWSYDRTHDDALVAIWVVFALLVCGAAVCGMFFLPSAIAPICVVLSPFVVMGFVTGWLHIFY